MPPFEIVHHNRPYQSKGPTLATASEFATEPYRLPAREERRYRERVIDLSEDIQAIGWKAQVRLCQRYRRLAATGKPQPKVTTAIARELVGYAWDIARRVSPAIAG